MRKNFLLLAVFLVCSCHPMKSDRKPSFDANIGKKIDLERGYISENIFLVDINLKFEGRETKLIYIEDYKNGVVCYKQEGDTSLSCVSK